MSISNTFHTSKKNHSISNAAALSKVQNHNSRGYFNFAYDASKIHNLIGDSSTLSDTVKKYINDKFEKEIQAYNDKQKRADRKINTDAFNYFSGNKNLDIANEMIFQLGDKTFWDQYRTDVIKKTKRNKEVVIKYFPEEIKVVMDEIFKKQAAAYENIYKTDKETILDKIKTAYANANKEMDEIEDHKRSVYLQLAMKKQKDREKSISKMSEEDKEEFGKFIENYKTISEIDKLKLIDRVEQDCMEIHLVDLAAHYDEFSVHAHGVSVCSASGYSSGLSSRVAKSVVLNRWTLEVIQDRLRDIAREEMKKHPDLFQDHELAEKGQGRNYDYSVEQYIREKQQEIKREFEEIDRKMDLINENIDELSQKQVTFRGDIDSDSFEFVAWCMDNLKGVQEAVQRFCKEQYMKYTARVERNRQEVVRDVSERKNSLEEQIKGAKGKRAEKNNRDRRDEITR